MRLRLRLTMASMLLGAAVACALAAAAPTAPTGARAPISSGQIKSAVEAVKRDPNLGGETTVRTLHWVKGDEPPPKDAPSWLRGLFAFLSKGSGVLLWILGAVAVAIAAVWVLRVARLHSPPQAPSATQAPSQVLAMDIRPDSLPNDVGAAALQLLGAGRMREALSLLYRGALSRAVHGLGVTIGESFTEGEVLGAVQTRLDAGGIRYFAELVRVWRRAVYAGEAVPAELVRPLCEEFRTRLGGAAV